MSDDWQPGDLALCIDDRPSMFWSGWEPKKGRIYTVLFVTADRNGLDLEEVSDAPAPYAARRFRKIRPHIPDEEDIETISLLTGAPVREPVA